MKPKTLFYAYSSLCGVHLLAHLLDFPSLIAWTKPLLMVLLAVYFIYAVGLKTKSHILIFVGIIFAQLGDTFLMYASGNMNFFIAGIGAFLVTQSLYAYSFYEYDTSQEGFLKKKPLWIIPFGLYWVGMLSVLLPILPTPLKIPVAIYSFVIVVMSLMALNLKSKIAAARWRMLMVGTLLFVLSDSLIAVNKFLHPLPIEGFLIMSTYLLAQWLIVNETNHEL
jgi:uncharacterized membrane protein YhhN